MYCEKFPIAQKDPGIFLITVFASFVLTLIKQKNFLENVSSFTKKVYLLMPKSLL